MEGEKKWCPGCKGYRHVSEFYGLRKPITAKCILCNRRASKYIRKITMLKKEEKNTI